MMEDVWRHYRWLLLASVVPCSVSLVALGSYEIVDQPAEITPYGIIIGLCLTLLFSHWLVWYRLIVPTSQRLQSSLKTLQTLRDNDALKSDIIDSVRDAIIVVDENARIVEASASARRIFAQQDNQLLGCDLISTIIPLKSQIAYSNYLKPYLQPANAATPAACACPVEFDAVRAHKQAVFPAEWMFHPITLADKHLVAIHVRDLSRSRHIETELVRQQEALYQAEKMSALGSLLSGVAHELNNPLSVVVGRAIMLEAEATSPQISSGIHKIREAAERCARVVKTFISMAKQSDSELGWVQCNDVIESVIEVTDQGLHNHNVELTLELAPDLPAMWADGAQLSQVLMNLIVNAQQALQEFDGPRRLAVITHFEQDTNTILIEVKDNGPGIPKELHSRVFEPFYTTKGTGVGMGVGLSVSFSIVQSHRGSITLQDNQTTESGAHFVIRLPIAPLVRS